MYFMCTHPSCDRDRRVRLDGMDADKDDDVPSFVGRTGGKRLVGDPQGESAMSAEERYAYTATIKEERMVVRSSVIQRSGHGGRGYLEKGSMKGQTQLPQMKADHERQEADIDIVNESHWLWMALV